MQRGVQWCPSTGPLSVCPSRRSTLKIASVLSKYAPNEKHEGLDDLCPIPVVVYEFPATTGPIETFKVFEAKPLVTPRNASTRQQGGVKSYVHKFRDPRLIAQMTHTTTLRRVSFISLY